MGELEDAIADATSAAVEESGGVAEEDSPDMMVGHSIPEKDEEKPADEEPAKEEEPEAEPEPEKEEAEEEVEEEVEGEPEPLVATAAALQAINDNPELRKIYKSMQRGMTEKTTKLAEERKQYKESNDLVTWMKENPDEAAQALANRRGYTLTRAEQKAADSAQDEAVDTIAKDWEAKVGPETTKLLLPLIRSAIEASTQQYVAPLQQQQETLNRQAAERGIAASVEEFGATIVQRGDDWDDSIKAEMATMSNKFSPGENVGLPEYLTAMYNSVMTERNQASAMKKQVKRLRKAKDTSEPTQASRPAPRAKREITSETSDRDAVDIAMAEALEEVRSS